MSKSFLKTLLKDKENESFFFSGLKRGRLKDLEEKKLSHKWSGRISPSSLSFSMCIYEFFKTEIHIRRDNTLEGLQSMSVGKALHDFYSQEALTIEGLLYSPPNVPKNLKLKFRKAWPEVYFHDEEDEVSGRIDLVLNIGQEPVVVDLKITQRDFNSFPLESHLTQICVYIYYLNKLKYYDQQISRGGILYQNPFTMQELEYYINYSDYREKTELLVSNLAENRVKYLNNELIECNYSLCRKHNK